MSITFGLDCKLYWDEEASYASPTWNEIDIVKDATLNMEKTESDVSIRATSWGLMAGKQKIASVDFQILWDPESAVFAALNDAFLNDTGINMAVMDGDIETPGKQGLRAIMMVSKFTRNETLPEAVTVDVTIKPTYHTVDRPEWLVVV